MLYEVDAVKQTRDKHDMYTFKVLYGAHCSHHARGTYAIYILIWIQ